MDGCMSEYWVHLEGVNQIRKQLENLATPLSRNGRIFTISSFLTILSDTTSLELPYLPWPGHPSFPSSDNDFSDSGYGLEFTYGITATLANIMHRMTILSQHISYFITNTIQFPSSLLSACSNLSNTLRNWSIESEPLYSLSSIKTDPTTLLLAKTHIQAFATALQIYYHTRVLPCPGSVMTQHVDRVGMLLSSIETIKTETGYNLHHRTASITWPGFIASCEAEAGRAREVWIQWWGQMQGYRIGNISQLWNVVQEAWRLRDQGINEVPAWMPVLRRSGRRVLAV